MKILQVNNIISHHQLPFARELIKLIGEENFLFAALDRPSLERIQGGWSEDYTENWIIHPNESLDQLQKYEEFWKEADIVICGERLVDRIQNRLDQEKICFYMSERWWKPPIGKLRLLNPRFLKMVINFKKLFRSPYFHYLSIGPFAAEDIKTISKGNSSLWSWGYFTELPESNIDNNEYPNSSSYLLNILWIGRMLKLKNVKLLIKTLALLQQDGKKFKLTLVGDGPERKKLEKLASKVLAEGSYEFNDFIASTEVHSLMSKFDVYVLPSNAYEGWGAVINEAMSMGCAVITSDKTGAGAALIKNGVNGLLFQSGSKSSLYKALNQVFNDRDLVSKLGKAGKSTIETQWNPESAAKKFFELATTLLSNEEFQAPKTGLLSKIE